LTSDTIAYLTDFAPYKPLYLDESQYNNIILFYPQVIEKCYFAPEKVNAEKSKVVYEYDKLTATELLDLQRMDIFSIGCIFAEIFTDSNPLFTYETLLQYSKGDKTALEKLNLITNPRIREMVTKMISLEPKGRDSLMDYFPIFKEFMPPGLFEAYTYLNYSIRRSEFSHPDVKLGLIRMIAPYLIDTLAKTATNENRQVIDSKLLSAQFIRCFPYNISKTAILFQFKSMLTTSILKSFVDPKDLTNFIDETMEQIRQKEVTVGSIDRQSAIFLDRVAHLKESKLNLNTVSYEGKSELEEEECPVKFEMKHEFEKIIKNSIKSQADIEKFDNMFIFAHLIETICSLIRSFQLSQSYLVALELLDVLSLFAKSEQILTLIIPYLQNKISERKDNLAIFYSINLLCKLVRRIEYIPKELAKDAGYNTYIKSILQSYSGDTSSVNNQIDKSFKYQIFRNIGSFIYLRLIFSVLNMKNKLEEKMKRESQFRSGEVPIHLNFLGSHQVRSGPTS
jgi:serine/threonine protein kinase